MVAPRLLWRYILRETLLHTLLGLFAITLLLVVQNLLRFLEDLVAAGVGLGALAQLSALILPAYVTYAIPTALLFGILISFGRMSADGEVVAMRACGVSVPRLLPPAVALGALAAAISAYMLFDVQPRARFAMRSLVHQLAGSVDVIEPGRFVQLGDRLLFVHALGDSSCPFEGILIGDASSEERSFYAAARCGALEGEASGPELAFVLQNGSIHLRDPDPTRYRRIRFQTMRTSVDISSFLDKPPSARDLRFVELLAAKRLAAEDPERVRLEGKSGTALDVQIQRRLSFPFASLLLAVVAVPLGIRPMRAGRSMGALTAIGVMAAYWMLFSLGELAAERGVGPAWLGLWLPNVVVFALSIWLVRRIARTDS
ncbi:MAG: LptF/LptG family permease [Myxococcota bacterium]